MNKEIAKAIPIADYLSAKGIHPQRQNGNSLWYISPFRKEQKASFKVNVLLNKWHDFGNDQKGDIIDLVMKLEQIDNFNTAIQFLKRNFNSTSFSFRGKEVLSNTKNNNAITNLKVEKLQHPALLELLQKRKIPKTLAENYCKEIHYDLNGKYYFAIGFENNKGGFATLNPYFKGCIAPNDISSFESNNISALVFEGVMDFLSYLTLKKRPYTKTPPQDYHILNSVHNVEKLLPKLKKYHKIYCFLDNDTSGKIALKKMTAQLGNRVFDPSNHYKNHKDLNDFLCAREREQEKTQSKRGKLSHR
ncbi:MAG: toprim domain-containing protein [Flavobacteriaceae bacterium]|nr:toprim domain-containing protein [Flavobacteriaceae bacterium]